MTTATRMQPAVYSFYIFHRNAFNNIDGDNGAINIIERVVAMEANASAGCAPFRSLSTTAIFHTASPGRQRYKNSIKIDGAPRGGMDKSFQG